MSEAASPDAPQGAVTDARPDSLARWLDDLAKWCDGFSLHSHFLERVHCFAEADERGVEQANFAVVLSAMPFSGGAQPGAALGSQAPSTENANKRSDSARLINQRIPAKDELFTRERAAERIQQGEAAAQPAFVEKAATPLPQGQSGKKRPRAATGEPALSLDRAKDFKRTDRIRISAISGDEGAAILNEDLLARVRLEPPPPDSAFDHVQLASAACRALMWDASLQNDAARYGIVLRATLLAKVAGSKANLALCINRLEDLRQLIQRAQTLPDISTLLRARLLRELCDLLEQLFDYKYDDAGNSWREGVPDAVPVIPEHCQKLPQDFKSAMNTASGLRWRDLRTLAWYAWRAWLPEQIKHGRVQTLVTGLGHASALGVFLSLLWLSVHPVLAPFEGATGVLTRLSAWQAPFGDGAIWAVIFGVLACACYALGTQRLSLQERVAISINDQIENVLNRALADLMKANMDVQLGRMGRSEPPGLIPEESSRKLDEIFALKELVNSYESTVRARLRHVAAEARKAEDIRQESQQRLRNAALGVTASFVLLEIGSRIQDHRDLQAGTDAFSFAYWLRNPGAAAAAGPEGLPTARAPAAMLECARHEVELHQQPSPECLDQWRDSSLASSSQLLFLVFLIALIMFVVRVMRRGGGPDAG
ncbi:hypothetical protein [Bordetella genomosp. 12]|uniref:Uncharacterized protein n=1 Tax=Bordetella genomosp. 12 TaxID=463035 RepID=A0A261V9N5_9BORD|nr:hypothetical protein [Bordetella genomosp. 12]OZI70866.1 hypothetical protein CAL22_13265 [Bordetella genomosp. 12]